MFGNLVLEIRFARNSIDHLSGWLLVGGFNVFK